MNTRLYCICERDRNDRMTVSTPHLHVVQPNTRFLCFPPLKWQTVDGGDGGGVQWMNLQECEPSKEMCRRVMRELFALVTFVSFFFVYVRNPEPTFCIISISFQLLFLCCNFSWTLWKSVIISFLSVRLNVLRKSTLQDYRSFLFWTIEVILHQKSILT